MNERLVRFLSEQIRAKNWSYAEAAAASGIPYPRLMRLLHRRATISGSELLFLCRALDVKQEELMALLGDTLPYTDSRQERR